MHVFCIFDFNAGDSTVYAAKEDCSRLLTTGVGSIVNTITASEPDATVLTLNPTGRVVFLVGPTGSGKTYSLRETPKILVSYLGDIDSWADLRASIAWGLKEDKNISTVVIDEIARQPNLSNFVSTVLDEPEFLAPVDQDHPLDLIPNTSDVTFVMVGVIMRASASGMEVVPHEVWSNRSSAIEALKQAGITDSLISRTAAVVSLPTVHRRR